MLYNLITLQDVAGSADGGGAGMMNLIFIIAIILIFYFFMMRPQQKKQKEIKKFRDGLTKGDKVITAGGIYGKIREIKEAAFVVEIADGVKITIDKQSVYPSASQAQEAAQQNSDSPANK